MDQSAIYGQQDFNLPHDVVKLPSKGVFYKPKKESLKVGYLTASDENLLMSQNIPIDGLITTLLKNKIYEPGFDVNQLLDADAKAVLLFLRNTSFGPEYIVSSIDPQTNRKFEYSLKLDEINFTDTIHKPNENGLFEFILPSSKASVKCKLLTLGDTNEIDKLKDSYPQGMIAPIITKRLEKHIVELNGDPDRMKIATFVNQMPISDSKNLRKLLNEAEPSINLKRTIIAPSGERVDVNIAFGVEFFRPFFSI